MLVGIQRWRTARGFETRPRRGQGVITYAQALELLSAAAEPLPAEARALDAAAGAIAAESVTSPGDVPPFDNAAMDGYALPASLSARASPHEPLCLRVSGTIAAGAAPVPGKPGAIWEIMTGAPLPTGCDAVIPVEQVAAREGAEIAVSAPVAPGRNVRRAGEDFRRGDLLLSAGERLDPHRIMALAAAGVARVRVRPAPRVAVVTTGSELLASGEPMELAHIHDANGPYLRALLARAGLLLTASSRAPDEAQALAEAIDAAASKAELVLTTGGVSAGRLDLVPAAVTALGGDILFHRVAIRPGKPILLARLPAGRLLLGLPGNPAAVAVGLRFFGWPLLTALQGSSPEKRCIALTEHAVEARERLLFFGKARATVNARGQLTVRLLPGQESFKISPLLGANCWLLVPPQREPVPAGAPLDIVPLYPGDFPSP